MLRTSTHLAALAVGLSLAACGGDDDQATKTTPTVQAGDVTRYCALSRQLDQAGERFFSRLESENASPKDFETAERRFVERYSAQFDELERVAPAEIKADARTLLASQRQRAGLETSTQVREADAAKAEKRVQAFEKRQCKR